MKFDTSKYSRDLRRYYQIPAVSVSLTLVLSFFVIAVFIAFALRPTIVSITSLKKTIEESQKTSQTLKTKVKNLQAASAQFESIQSMLPKLNASVPNKGVDYAGFVKAVEAMASQTGIMLDTESLGASILFSRLSSPFSHDKTHGAIELKYQIGATGSYPQLQLFLNELLQWERILMIESISISPANIRSSSSDSTKSDLKLEITGNAYYLADEADINKAIETKKGKK